MMDGRPTLGLLFAMLAATAAASAQTAPPAATPLAGLSRTELQRHDLSVPDREMHQVRVGFPTGAEAGRHSHPGEEIVYVLEGELEYVVEGRPTIILREGDVLFIAAGAEHAVRNVGPGPASELATYILVKGEPPVRPGR